MLGTPPPYLYYNYDQHARTSRGQIIVQGKHEGVKGVPKIKEGGQESERLGRCRQITPGE